MSIWSCLGCQNPCNPNTPAARQGQTTHGSSFCSAECMAGSEVREARQVQTTHGSSFCSAECLAGYEVREALRPWGFRRCYLCGVHLKKGMGLNDVRGRVDGVYCNTACLRVAILHHGRPR